MLDYTAQIFRLFSGSVPEIIREPMTVKAIAQIVADEYDIPLHEIMGERRHKETTVARHVAQWLCKKHAGWSLAHTGRRFNKHHTSVIHACRLVDASVASNMAMAARVGRLSHIIEERWP